MSKGQTLRALVKERLALAAEDIFVLFERTIAEYEEELCRSKEENQRKQQLLEQLHRASVQENVPIPSWSPGPGLKQEILESGQMKEEPKEQSFKQLPVPVPESSGVCVKTEEASLPTQRLCEHREETQDRSDISSETETETGQPELNDEHWEPPFSCPAAQMETEHYSQVHSTDTSSKLSPLYKLASENISYSGDLSEAEEKKHQCPFCQKRFGTKQTLKTHIRVHTGEKPFGCPVCKKNFTQKSSLNLHLRIHTGEKPFCCSFCNKTFAQKCNLKTHMITHQGLKCQNMFGSAGLTEGT